MSSRPVVVAIAVLVLSLTACSARDGAARDRGADGSRPGEPPAGGAPRPVSAAADPPTRSGRSINPSEPVGAPLAVRIPSIGVRSDLVRLGVAEDGTATVPRDPDAAGWFAGGPRPGDPGPAVIAGHVDSARGPAVFFRLHELRPGDTAVVDTTTGPVTFVVDRVIQVTKDGFPTDDVYGPTPERGLHLVTCGGSFDRGTGHYRDNVIVSLTVPS